MGFQAFTALSKSCSQSLKALHLDVFNAKTLKACFALRNCVSLETLSFGVQYEAEDLQGQEEALRKNVADWLRKCTQLRDVIQENSVLSCDPVRQALLGEGMSLRKLRWVGPLSADMTALSREFQRQPNLRSLSLHDSNAASTSIYYNGLVDALGNLSDLRSLRLYGESLPLEDHHIFQIVERIPTLEHLGISSVCLTDAVWPSLAALKNLCSIHMEGVTCFTAKGIMNFVSTLGPGQGKFKLMIDDAVEYCALSPEELTAIRDVLSHRVGGSFEFALIPGRQHARSWPIPFHRLTLESLQDPIVITTTKISTGLVDSRSPLDRLSLLSPLNPLSPMGPRDPCDRFKYHRVGASFESGLLDEF